MFRRNRFSFAMLWAIIATLILANNAMAYVGPGAGMEFIGYSITLLAVCSLPFLMICALIGYLLGRSKGLALTGAITGFFLGPLGWLIIAQMRNRNPTCPYCKGYIVEGTQKCKNCGSNVTP